MKSATKYHNSSTTANGIGPSQKLGKQNRKRPGRTTDPSNELSTTSNIHEKLNKNTDITSNKSLTAETHFSTKSFAQDKTADMI